MRIYTVIHKPIYIYLFSIYVYIIYDEFRMIIPSAKYIMILCSRLKFKLATESIEETRAA